MNQKSESEDSTTNGEKSSKRPKYGVIRIALVLAVKPNGDIHADDTPQPPWSHVAMTAGKNIPGNAYMPITGNKDGDAVPDFVAMGDAEKWLRTQMEGSLLPMGDYAFIREKNTIRFEEVRSIKMTDLD